MFRYWLTFFYHSLRYLRAKKRHKTLRVKVSDFVKFTHHLNNNNTPLIILRWEDKVPITKQQGENYSEDIDCLIDENNIWSVIKSASLFPGKIKVDLYGLCGRNGTSYNSMPYYPPFISQRIYNSRIKHHNKFFVLNKQDHLLSFAYHIVYHKGEDSGFPYDNTKPINSLTDNKYFHELRKLDTEAIFSKDGAYNLLNIHQVLKEHDWSMPLDLMSRWQGNTGTISKLKNLEEGALLPLIKTIKNLTIFVIRSDAIIDNSYQIIDLMIQEKFSILSKHKLTNTQSEKLMKHTRGGNWLVKGKSTETKPIEVWLAKSLYKEKEAPSSKQKRKYPHVENFDVLIKRDIRSAVNKLDNKHRVVLHASDNAIEAAIIISIIFGKNWKMTKK